MKQPCGKVISNECVANTHKSLLSVLAKKVDITETLVSNIKFAYTMIHSTKMCYSIKNNKKAANINACNLNKTIHITYRFGRLITLYE